MKWSSGWPTALKPSKAGYMTAKPDALNELIFEEILK
jgi:hypothetical protein